MYRNIVALIIVLMHCCVTLNAQDCYNYTRNQGISFYNKGDYNAAKLRFIGAKECPDKPAGHDLDTWIKKCDSALAAQRREEEGRRQEEERLRSENLRKEQERKSEEERMYASKGFMNIDRIEFKYNTKSSGNTLYSLTGSNDNASDITYLYPYIYYSGLTSQNKNISLDVKIIKPSGALSHGNTSPEGFTYSDENTISPGNNNCLSLSGWGSKSGGSYMSGIYRIEIWYRGNKLYQQTFRIPGPTIKIKDITFDEGVYENDVKGIRIHVKFATHDLTQVRCSFCLNGISVKDKYFYLSSDADGEYSARIFVSNSELYGSQHFKRSDRNYFVISVSNGSPVKVLDISSEYYFNL